MLPPVVPVPRLCIVCGTTPIAGEIHGLAIWECPKCFLLWRQSFDVPLSHYQEAEGGFSKEKEALQRRNIADRIRTIAKSLSLNDTCDIGGSKGYFVEALLHRGYTGVYGIDPNKVQVEAAQKRGISMLIASTSDVHTLFPERKTQNATLFHVIEHLEDPLRVLLEISDALPVGGHLVVETPDFDSYVFKKTNYVHKLVYEEHLFYFSRRNLAQLLAKAGFVVERTEARDFDQYHLNARESLFRLGVMRRDGRLSFLQKILYMLARTFTMPLSIAVKVSGRNSFMLLIARKS